MLRVSTSLRPCLALLLMSVHAPSAGGLDWQATNGARFALLPISAPGAAGFSAVQSSQTSVFFTNVLHEMSGLTNQVLMSGSGVAAGDIDNDGLCDLYFCGLDSRNALYRNLGGWRFQDVTGDSVLRLDGQYATGAVFADVDGDDDLDLLVTALGAGVRLFLNDSRGNFRDGTRDAGLTSKAAGMSMALSDTDGDGDLDLYVANYRTTSLQDEPGTRFRVSVTNGRPAITLVDNRPITPAESVRYSFDPQSRTILEHGEADMLYRNDGRGRFTLLSWTDGSFLDEDGKPSTTPYDWGLSAIFRDMNGDLAPDLYVCNDTDSPDRVWINDGAGRFRAIAALAIRQTCLSSMGVDFADINRDGFDDFFVADMLSRSHVARHTQMMDRHRPYQPGAVATRPQFMRNMLYLNRGDASYAEIAQFAGVDASDWAWMPVFLDVDLDGYEDLLITTGLERSLRDADARRQIDAMKAQRKLSKQEFHESRRIMPKLASPNFAFRNRGDLTFEEYSSAWGFDSTRVSHGMALADLDNDGDLDIAVNCMNEPALLYRNNSSAPRIGVRLKGKAPNTRGIGARIKVTGGPVTQSQQMICGGRYLSGDEPLRVFAAGTAAHTIEVTWRNGTRTVLSTAGANRVYELSEAAATPELTPSKPESSPALFTDISQALNHRHHEELFNDFDRQPLLPRQFSQLGPGISWADVNHDGWDDLLIAGGRGGELALFINNRQAGLNRVNTRAVTSLAPGDYTAVIASASPDGGTVILAAVSSYEASGTNPPALAQYDLWAGGLEAKHAVAGNEASVGPVAVADIDADGDLDCFLGGRIVPGRYPEPAPSRLLVNDGQRFTVAQEVRGLASDALFSDLTGDGLPELIIASDSGPVRVFRNGLGRFTEITADLGLAKLNGWWNGVSAGDFDGDGRLDLAASNWGRNSKYQYYARKPLRLYFGDLDDNGTVDVAEAYYDPGSRKYVPWARWDALAQCVPTVAARFSSFAGYAQASVEDILGERPQALQVLEINTLDSAIFLNRGNQLEMRRLPVEAQLAPAFGACVADFNGDGHHDLFLAQNFFAVDAFTSRYDAGRGLLLQGDGAGNLTAVAAARSGLEVYGEQRGAAAADFDGDGRVDLAVTQNGAATKLFRNTGGIAGLRVRLRGPAGNPVGIGAVVTALNGSNAGPACEIRAGGGYWSQNSATLVMALPVQKLRVRWPGGKVIEYPVPAGSREVILAIHGGVDVAK